jgi:tRNA-2-methylthio-N6-dimethylallyladenosine synthase
MVTQQAGAHAPAPADPGSARTFQVRTYGCQMNVHDS